MVNKWKVLVILFAKWVLLLVDQGNRPGVLKVCEKYWNYNFCDGFTLGLLSRSHPSKQEEKQFFI